MISVFDRPEDCCGCSACRHVCPVQAIALKADPEGFLYPEIDQGLCIDCGACREVCAFQHPGRGLGSSRPEAHAARHRDEGVRAASTSGGVFTALADLVLADGGVVFGAVLGEGLRVQHREAGTRDELDALRGSKYVQSDLGEVFPRVAGLLSQGRRVLFTGTPCQTAGLASFLGPRRGDGLLLVDLICHGTPSPLIWQEHLKALGARRGSPVVAYQFRAKDRGWHGHLEKAFFADGGSDCGSLLSQSFKGLFYEHYALRPACHCCPYTRPERSSDLTIADYWGLEALAPDFDDNRGTSLILVNTERGRAALRAMAPSLELRPGTLESCRQPQLRHPSRPSPRRQAFWDDYKLHGYDYILKEYAGLSLPKRAKRRLGLMLKRLGILGAVKRLLGR